jgi:ubiquinone/menaquinone biosynthesis C-methylase UbiE
MSTEDMSSEDSKTVVQSGYDKIAQTYLDWTRNQVGTARTMYTEKLLSLAPDPSQITVLELGCGAGVPITQLLAQRCAHVIANDISQTQIDMAKANVTNTNVQFIRGDMTKLPLEPASMDAVVAFYSIIHLPRDEQKTMLRQIWEWLSDGGYLVCNFGVEDDQGKAEEWLGAKMYWSSFDSETYLQVVKEIGFTVVESRVHEDAENGRLVPFLWLVVRKVRGTS